MCRQQVVSREYSVLSTRFNTCLTYFKVASKIKRDFDAQCSLFTYAVSTVRVSLLLWVIPSLADVLRFLTTVDTVVHIKH